MSESVFDEWTEDYEPEYFDDADNCDHQDAELTWDGDLECSCGHVEHLTAQQIDEYYAAMDRMHAELDAMCRQSIFSRAREFVLGLYRTAARAIKRRVNPKQAEMDDDIPF